MTLVDRARRVRLALPRAVGRALALVAAYSLLAALFAHESRARGLLSPGGTPHFDVLALGAACVALRVVVVLFVPADLAFAAAIALARRRSGSRAPRPGRA